MSFLRVRIFGEKPDALVKSPKSRHACESRHPDHLKSLDSRFRGNDNKGFISTFYETIKDDMERLFSLVDRASRNALRRDARCLG